MRTIIIYSLFFIIFIEALEVLIDPWQAYRGDLTELDRSIEVYRGQFSPILYLSSYYKGYNDSLGGSGGFEARQSRVTT